MKLNKKLSTVLAALLLMTGCGQLGPLFLPDEAPPATESSEESEEISEEES